MKDKIEIKLWNNRVRFEIEIKQSITLLVGNSGTGKTTLIRMLREYVEYKRQSGIKIDTSIEEDRIHVISDDNDCEIQMNKGRIDILYFADGNVKSVKTKEFSEFLKRTGSWLVYACRDDLIKYLNFSVHEIYEIQSSKKDAYYMHSFREVYFNNKNVKNQIGGRKVN